MCRPVSSHKQEPVVTGGRHLWLGLVSFIPVAGVEARLPWPVQPRARSAASAHTGRARGAPALLTRTLSQTEHPGKAASYQAVNRPTAAFRLSTATSDPGNLLGHPYRYKHRAAQC